MEDIKVRIQIRKYTISSARMRSSVFSTYVTSLVRLDIAGLKVE